MQNGLFTDLETDNQPCSSTQLIGLVTGLWKITLPIAYALGHALAQLVEALRYKPEGRGFDSRWCHWT
jgi:hypothetical protein